MDNKDKLEWLRFLSTTHRAEFNERRKHEWKALLSLLTFYALCGASVLSSKLQVPANPSLNFGIPLVFLVLIFGIPVVFLSVALIASFFLMDLHSANNINKDIAEKSEHTIVDILGGLSPETNREKMIPNNDRKKELQIYWWDLLPDFLKCTAQKKAKPKVGLWSCRAQILILFLFAIASAVFIIVNLLYIFFINTA